MKVAFLLNEGFSIEHREIPSPKEDEVIIRLGFCGICGTDLHKIADPLFPRPVVLGHEIAGTVAKVGVNVNKFSVGDRVFVAHHVPCFTCASCQRGDFSLCPHFKETNVYPGGFSEFIKLSQEHVAYTLYKVPKIMTLEQASFIEPLSCCIHGQRKLGVRAGDRVLIMGAGSIGLLQMQLARLNLAKEVYVSDVSPSRLNLARKLGADDTFNIREHSLEEYLSSYGKMDMIIIAAGVVSLLNEALHLVNRGGRILVFASLHGNTELDVSRFFADEIKIGGAYSSTPYDYPIAIQLLAQKKVVVDDMISSIVPLENIEEGIRLAQDPKELKVLIKG